jgi:hypothetical protein
MESLYIHNTEVQTYEFDMDNKKYTTIDNMYLKYIYIYIYIHEDNWVRVMILNATFNNISVIAWRSVLLVEETRVH